MKNSYKTMLRPAWMILVLIAAVAGCGKAEKEANIASDADLEGKTVATMPGTMYDIEYSKQEGVTIMRLPSTSDLIAAVKQGRADAFLEDEPNLNKQTLRENGLREAYRLDMSFPEGFGFRKEDQPLVDAFNAFMAEMEADGSMDELRKKWLDAEDCSTVVMATDTMPVPDGAPLRVGTGINIAPLLFSTGRQWRGLEAELLMLFGQRIGRPIQVSFCDFTAISPAVQTGSLDVMGGGVFITEERQKVLAFTDPFTFCHGGCYVVDADATSETGFVQGIKESFHKTLVVEERWRILTRGLWVTVRITLLSMLFGTLLGLGLYAMRVSRRRWMRSIEWGYSVFMRGIPMVVLLMILFYVILSGQGGLLVAVVAFSMSFASFVSEMTVTAVEGVGTGQREAAMALGFTPWKTIRLIIAPQALRRALPHFKSEAVSLIKNTSIVGYIAIEDITRASDMIRSRTFEAFFPLLLVTIVYFLLAWLLSKLVDYLFNLGMKI